MDMVKYKFAGSYRTVAGIARLTGVSADTIRKRLKRGMSITDAIYDGHLQQRSKAVPDPIRSIEGKRFYTFDGKSLSLPRWAEQLGIKENTLRDRIHQHGWSIERAFTTPPMPNFKHRSLRKRNAEIIRKMLEGFHAPAQTRTATIAKSTGGYEPISTNATGTGAGRHETHFEGTSA